MKIIKHIIATIALLCIAINSIVCACFVLIFGLTALIMPVQTIRRALLNLAHFIVIAWAKINHFALMLNLRKRQWDILYSQTLDPKASYMMISNHQSWVDILVLVIAFNYKIPPLKFFMKRELLWQLPIVGLACYCIGYPFMRRHTRSEIRKNPKLKGKDVETTRKACAKFKERPTTIINFVEGSRYTEKKHAHQASPFQYLLKPRAGGLALVLEAMHKELSGLIDVTLCYPENKLHFWQFLCGDFKKVSVRYRVLPITRNLIGNYYEDREFRKSFQQSLNAIWQEKDDLLKQLQALDQ